MLHSASRVPPALSIDLLDTPLIDANARLIAEAMEVDPAYRYLLPRDQERAAGLRAFFTGNQRVHLRHRCIYVARGQDGRLCGTVTLRPPGGIDISTLAMLRHGLVPFALRHGRGAVRRLFWLRDTYDELEHEATGGAPHLYVHMMAVEPERQGRGVGTQLIADVLARGQREHPGVRFVLTTHLPQNVVFYRRAGFEVSSERMLSPPGGTPYTVWSMRREP